MDRLIKYIYEVYIRGKPRNYYEKDLFLQESYGKFWAKQILDNVYYYDSIDFQQYLQALIDDLSEWMTRSKNRDQDWIFAVGYDVATDILGFVIAEGD